MKLFTVIACVAATMASASASASASDFDFDFEDVKLPTPTLTKDFHLECDLNPKLGLGEGPGGTLWNWISFTGGRWNATWGNGTIEVMRPFSSSSQDENIFLTQPSSAATTTNTSFPNCPQSSTRDTSSRQTTKSRRISRSRPTGGELGPWTCCRHSTTPSELTMSTRACTSSGFISTCSLEMLGIAILIPPCGSRAACARGPRSFTMRTGSDRCREG